MLAPFIQLVGPHDTLQVGNVKLLGFDEETARKLLFTVIVLVVLGVLSRLLRWLSRKVGGARQRTAFWTNQGISLVTLLLGVIGILSIWFDDPTRLATGLGLFSAGLAFALQKVITSFAGYFVILRSEIFNVGDRISMGGVRGDVISLNFIQTVIMEMGQPPAVQTDDPGMWVKGRQYSGRVVTISNSEIFEEPVYNYTREFPFLWEEMTIPISYKDDRHKAEEIIFNAVDEHTHNIAEQATPEIRRMHQEFFIDAPDLNPRVYLRITDNWVELSVRFLCLPHDIRGLKDKISRQILEGLDAAGIGIASSTYDVVGMPPIKVEVQDR